MAVKTWTELHEYVQEYFLENYDEDITAEHLRVFLVDLLDTIAAVISSGSTDIRRGKVYCTTAGTLVSFDQEFDDMNFVIIGRVYDGHKIILHQEYDITTTGLTVKPVLNGYYSYVAVPT
jgi:hypothetical protein